MTSLRKAAEAVLNPVVLLPIGRETVHARAVSEVDLDALRAALDADTAERAEIVAVLREVEWSDHNDSDEDYGYSLCPVCGGVEQLAKHAVNCRLSALLTRLGESP